METVPKKERLLLIFGFTLCAALLTGHYLSGLSRNLAAGRDLSVALIGGNAPMVFVYHSFSKTVTAVHLPRERWRSGGSNYQKACAALALVSGGPQVQREDVFYLAPDAPGVDLSAFYETLNSWRSRPRLVLKAARWLWRLKKEERTNISFHDLLLTVLELSRLNSSDFVVTDFERGAGPKPQADGSVADSARPDDSARGHRHAGGRSPRQASVTVADSPPKAEQAPHFGPFGKSAGQAGVFPTPAARVGAVIRVEVLNASGKKDLAMQVTKYLRKKGFDVIDFGTYTGTGKLTKIVNCSGNVAAAKAVRSALGLTALEIYSKFEAGNVAEVSVILGEDFNEEIIKSR
ncbi:MAG TPA: hypothetical protein DCG50_00505 [Elusimicrobia bacterium]|nr:hypothetical protein [Elusimicrobiota bacterium]